jgi:hypothetical protein
MTFGRTLTERREQREAERERNMASLCTPSKAICKGSYTGSTTSAAPKEPEPVRDESYRRWVASLPCFECGIEGYSNAAHPNSGKTKGVKRDDDECFPLCVDRPGIKGCHSQFDQYELVMRHNMALYERAALEWTREQQGAKA